MYGLPPIGATRPRLIGLALASLIPNPIMYHACALFMRTHQVVAVAVGMFEEVLSDPVSVR